MRASSHLVLVLILAYLLIVLAMPEDGQAQDAGELAFPPTDIVMILDQSGSTDISDESDLRLQAARTMVDILMTFGVSSDVRFSLVEFRSAEIDPNQVILSQPLVSVDLADLEFPLEGTRHAPGTDFRGPLCLGWLAVVGGSLPDGIGCSVPVAEQNKVLGQGREPERRKVAILFTDGGPAPLTVDLEFRATDPSAGCAAAAEQASSEGHKYMCELADLWARLTAQEEVELYVVGLDAQGTYWDKSEPYWRTITQCGTECALRVIRVAEAANLIPVIMRPISGSREIFSLCDEEGKCHVDFLTAEARFIIIQGPSAVVKDPNGVAVATGDLVKHVENENLDLWTVVSPMPGDWEVETRDPSAELQVALIQTPARLSISTEPRNPVRSDPFTVAVELVSPEGEALLLSPEAEPIEYSLAIALEDEQGDRFGEQRVTGILDSTQHRFENISVPTGGTYLLEAELTVEGRRFAAGRNEVSVAEPPPPQIVISRVGDDVGSERFTTEDLQPPSGYPLKIFGPAKLPVKVALQDELLEDPATLSRWFNEDVSVTVSLDVIAAGQCDDRPCRMPPIDVVFPADSSESVIEVALPSAWDDGTELNITARADGVLWDGSPWTAESEPLALVTDRSSYSERWDMWLFGYWVPIAVLGLLAFGVSFVETYRLEQFPGVRYVDLGVRRGGSSDSRLGRLHLFGIVVRPFVSNSGGLCLLSKEWLIFGRPVIRVFNVPIPFGGNTSRTSEKSASSRKGFDAFRRAIAGDPAGLGSNEVADLTIQLIEKPGSKRRPRERARQTR